MKCHTTGCNNKTDPGLVFHGNAICERCFEEIVAMRAWRIKHIRTSLRRRAIKLYSYTFAVFAAADLLVIHSGIRFLIVWPIYVWEFAVLIWLTEMLLQERQLRRGLENSTQKVPESSPQKCTDSKGPPPESMLQEAQKQSTSRPQNE